MKGKIIRAVAGYYYVFGYEDGRTHQCRARGIFRKDGRQPLVGDEVLFDLTHTEDTEGTVDEILPRKNSLIRPPVANVDQALIVFALRDPEPNLSLLDRFLVLMERQKIPAVIVFNKDDLDEKDTFDGIARVYRDCGCQVFSMSIRTGEGVDRVRHLFDNKTTVLAGPIHPTEIYSAIGQCTPQAGLPRFRSASFDGAFPFGVALFWVCIRALAADKSALPGCRDGGRGGQPPEPARKADHTAR